jgi:hypothetical protein
MPARMSCSARLNAAAPAAAGPDSIVATVVIVPVAIVTLYL